MKKRVKLPKNSIVVRIVAIIIALVLPINILTIILGNKLIEESRKQAEEETRNTLSVAMSFMEDELVKANRKLIYLCVSDLNFVMLEDADTPEKDVASYLKNASDRVGELADDYKYIDMSYFYFEDTGHTLMEGTAGVSSSYITDMIDSLDAKCDENYGAQWEVFEANGKLFLVSCTKWKNTKFGTVTNLGSALTKMSLTGENRIYAFSNLDETIYISNRSDAFEEKEYKDYKTGRSYKIFEDSMEDYDLKLVAIEEDSDYLHNLSGAIIVLEALAILLTLLAIPLLLYFMRRWVLRPINRLNYAMDKIEGGNLDYRLDENGEKNEFERIAHNFNSMMDQVEDLKIDVYEKEIEERNIRVQYLNQQIQPHFILNALNILYSYEPEEYELSQKMILCISRYFRHIVYANDKFVTLKAEMDHLKNYFEIQKARFPELFYSIVEYEDDLADALVPPLLFQSFAENSIKHSLKIGNRITIFVVAEHFAAKGEDCPHMRIRFADTGEGISDQVLEEIERFRETGEEQPHLGVGIQNSISRLKVIYGEESSIRISRDPNYPGTNIEIILPVHFKGEGDTSNENFTD